MTWWQRQSDRNSRNRLIALLRRERRSVEELASELGVTANAVRAQLAALEREGVVQAVGVRRDGTVGKPATLYGIAPVSSALFSSAYGPVLVALLAELGGELAPRQLAALLRRTGRRLGKSIPARPTLGGRVAEGAAFLTAMGADAEVIQTGEGYEIRGHGCVLAAAVAECPATCAVVAELLRGASGEAVSERCDRADRPNCRFFIAALG